MFAYGAATYETLDAQPLPRKLIDVRPVYPPIAVSAGLAGRVVIDGTLDDSGRVADAHVRQSVPLLDQAALDAVRRWVFERTESTARRRQIRITVTYTL